MNFTGIDKIIHGVEDLAECIWFNEDCGLVKTTADEKIATFKTMGGSEIVLYIKDNPALLHAIEEGSTLRHVIWGSQMKNIVRLFGKKYLVKSAILELIVAQPASTQTVLLFPFA